ncbi:hypothetical protein [Lichenihabitans psoromatis]|uniref:hypothetical protein n=1 Tax=Lichenihabitans psoromatis TaxID=2528642 RepID=UPI001035F247|nr:hypothetical protein [Lichenihabitans psoromatis]
MTGVTPVGQSTSAAATDPGSDQATADMQQAFAEGVVKFMGTVLQSTQADITEAINDNTSNPDAPG